jgi:hypothetical protein
LNDQTSSYFSLFYGLSLSLCYSSFSYFPPFFFIRCLQKRIKGKLQKKKKFSFPSYCFSLFGFSEFWLWISLFITFKIPIDDYLFVFIYLLSFSLMLCIVINWFWIILIFLMLKLGFKKGYEFLILLSGFSFSIFSFCI